MKQQDFYIYDDGIRIHLKLDFPQDMLKAADEDTAGKICVNDTEGKKSGMETADALSGSVRNRKYPLLIVIHGFTGNMEEEHLLSVVKTASETGFVVLRAEMYGHGESGGAFHDHTLFKWISNAMAVIDYARSLDYVSDLYLCGHSQGGLITMLVGAMEQDRLKAILPLSPAWMIPEIARKGELLGIPFDPDDVPDKLDIDKGLTLGNNYIRTAQMIDVLPAIRRFKKPVLLVHGDGDLSVPVHYSEKAADLYADARLVIIPGDTHCYDLHKDQLAEAVRSFLEEMIQKSG